MDKYIPKIGDVVRYIPTKDVYKVAFYGTTRKYPLEKVLKLVYHNGNVRWARLNEITPIQTLTLKGSRGTPSYCEDCKKTVIPGSVCIDGSDHQ